MPADLKNATTEVHYEDRGSAAHRVETPVFRDSSPASMGRGS